MVRVFQKIEQQPEIARHGQVMTKPHIVDLILDLSGYQPSADLSHLRLLDPGCGDGEFIVRAAERLLTSIGTPVRAAALGPCLLGIEKDPSLAEQARTRLVTVLCNHGVARATATRVSRQWIAEGNFLHHDLESAFDFIVGNPPYVRQEAMSKEDLASCRSDLRCFYDRADLYVAFLERGLSLLSPRGVLGFICPNRFTRNKYGTKIRNLITSEFQVRHTIDLAQASPFVPEVMAYPGIYIVGRGKTKSVDFFLMTQANPHECDEVRDVLYGERSESPQNGVRYHRYDEWFKGSSPWITESPAHLDIVRRIESQFACLGSTASKTKVGIGVATGADKVFIVPNDFPEVESDLLVPLVTTEDCRTGKLQWHGKAVINPFAGSESSKLIDFRDYPMARRYFERHKPQLTGRNVAKRNRSTWYRTIDRIYPQLIHQPKLLIPDIKADGVVVYDSGEYYPHHNLYFIVAEEWDLLALRTLLKSSIAKFFVWMYGVRMRSNFLRFQAQYLRRIPIPNWSSLSSKTISGLLAIDETADVDEIDRVVRPIYGLKTPELRMVREAMNPPASVDETA